MILKHQSSKAWATICDVGAFYPSTPEDGPLGTFAPEVTDPGLKSQYPQRTVVKPPKDVAGFEELLGRLSFTNGVRHLVLIRQKPQGHRLTLPPLPSPAVLLLS